LIPFDTFWCIHSLLTLFPTFDAFIHLLLFLIPLPHSNSITFIVSLILHFLSTVFWPFIVISLFSIPYSLLFIHSLFIRWRRVTIVIIPYSSPFSSVHLLVWWHSLIVVGEEEHSTSSWATCLFDTIYIDCSCTIIDYSFLRYWCCCCWPRWYDTISFIPSFIVDDLIYPLFIDDVTYHDHLFHSFLPINLRSRYLFDTHDWSDTFIWWYFYEIYIHFVRSDPIPSFYLPHSVVVHCSFDSFHSSLVLIHLRFDFILPMLTSFSFIYSRYFILIHLITFYHSFCGGTIRVSFTSYVPHTFPHVRYHLITIPHILLILHLLLFDGITSFICCYIPDDVVLFGILLLLSHSSLFIHCSFSLLHSTFWPPRCLHSSMFPLHSFLTLISCCIHSSLMISYLADWLYSVSLSLIYSFSLTFYTLLIHLHSFTFHSFVIYILCCYSFCSFRYSIVRSWASFIWYIHSAVHSPFVATFIHFTTLPVMPFWALCIYHIPRTLTHSTIHHSTPFVLMITFPLLHLSLFYIIHLFGIYLFIYSHLFIHCCYSFVGDDSLFVYSHCPDTFDSFILWLLFLVVDIPFIVHYIPSSCSTFDLIVIHCCYSIIHSFDPICSIHLIFIPYIPWYTLFWYIHLHSTFIRWFILPLMIHSHIVDALPYTICLNILWRYLLIFICCHCYLICYTFIHSTIRSSHSFIHIWWYLLLWPWHSLLMPFDHSDAFIHSFIFIPDHTMHSTIHSLFDDHSILIFIRYVYSLIFIHSGWLLTLLICYWWYWPHSHCHSFDDTCYHLFFIDDSSSDISFIHCYEMFSHSLLTWYLLIHYIIHYSDYLFYSFSIRILHWFIVWLTILTSHCALMTSFWYHLLLLLIHWLPFDYSFLSFDYPILCMLIFDDIVIHSYPILSIDTFIHSVTLIHSHSLMIRYSMMEEIIPSFIWWKSLAPFICFYHIHWKAVTQYSPPFLIVPFIWPLLIPLLFICSNTIPLYLIHSIHSDLFDVIRWFTFVTCSFVEIICYICYICCWFIHSIHFITFIPCWYVPIPSFYDDTVHTLLLFSVDTIPFIHSHSLFIICTSHSHCWRPSFTTYLLTSFCYSFVVISTLRRIPIPSFICYTHLLFRYLLYIYDTDTMYLFVSVPVPLTFPFHLLSRHHSFAVFIYSLMPHSLIHSTFLPLHSMLLALFSIVLWPSSLLLSFFVLWSLVVILSFVVIHSLLLLFLHCCWYHSFIHSLLIHAFDIISLLQILFVTLIHCYLPLHIVVDEIYTSCCWYIYTFHCCHSVVLIHLFVDIRWCCCCYSIVIHSVLIRSHSTSFIPLLFIHLSLIYIVHLHSLCYIHYKFSLRYSLLLLLFIDWRWWLIIIDDIVVVTLFIIHSCCYSMTVPTIFFDTFIHSFLRCSVIHFIVVYSMPFVVRYLFLIWCCSLFILIPLLPPFIHSFIHVVVDLFIVPDTHTLHSYVYSLHSFTFVVRYSLLLFWKHFLLIIVVVCCYYSHLFTVHSVLVHSFLTFYSFRYFIRCSSYVLFPRSLIVAFAIPTFVLRALFVVIVTSTFVIPHTLFDAFSVIHFTTFDSFLLIPSFILICSLPCVVVTYIRLIFCSHSLRAILPHSLLRAITRLSRSRLSLHVVLRWVHCVAMFAMLHCCYCSVCSSRSVDFLRCVIGTFVVTLLLHFVVHVPTHYSGGYLVAISHYLRYLIHRCVHSSFHLFVTFHYVFYDCCSFVIHTFSFISLPTFILGTFLFIHICSLLTRSPPSFLTLGTFCLCILLLLPIHCVIHCWYSFCWLHLFIHFIRWLISPFVDLHSFILIICSFPFSLLVIPLHSFRFVFYWYIHYIVFIDTIVVVYIYLFICIHSNSFILTLFIHCYSHCSFLIIRWYPFLLFIRCYLLLLITMIHCWYIQYSPESIIPPFPVGLIGPSFIVQLAIQLCLASLSLFPPLLHACSDQPSSLLPSSMICLFILIHSIICCLIRYAITLIHSFSHIYIHCWSYSFPDTFTFFIPIVICSFTFFILI